MARLWPKFSTVSLAILFLGAAGVAGPLRSAAYAQQKTYSGNNKSWTDSVSSSFKQGFDKLGQALTPKPAVRTSGSEDDPVSLKSTAKPSTELFVAIARLYEQAGKLPEAEQQYQLALKQKPDDLSALLGYAHLKESLGKPSDAIHLYQRAMKAHPQQASPHNNLGLYYARQNRLAEAVAALDRAVELDPKNPLYRNNMATVLVDQGNVREALRHLRAVYDEAAACYNVGYLLTKKGQTQAAMQQFASALRADPSMDSARRWLEYLQRSSAQARLSQHPVGTGVKVTSPPSHRMAIGSEPTRANVMNLASGEVPVPAIPPRAPQEDAPLPPAERMPQRLPATILRRPASDGPTLPGISYERSTAPAAPLPPPSTNSALRPLPRVY